MTSHSYNLNRAECYRLVLLPLLPVILFAAGMHLAAPVLPRPFPRLDVDRTIILHKAQLSETRDPAGILLIGDSSCLMDVAAVQLGACLTNKALNLGTLSYLSLDSYAELLQHYFSANPNSVRRVVLLINPQALRQSGTSDFHVNVLDSYYAQVSGCGPEVSRLACWLGVERFRNHLLARSMPLPLPGNYGARYGFTWDLWRYLSNNEGSAIDPGAFDASSAETVPEYRLAKTLEARSVAFRKALPAGVELSVGITPVPMALAGPEYRVKRDQMLRQFAQWLSANRVLDALPPALPNQLFASATHLNEAGQKEFTRQLCATLGSTR